MLKKNGRTSEVQRSEQRVNVVLFIHIPAKHWRGLKTFWLQCGWRSLIWFRPSSKKRSEEVEVCSQHGCDVTVRFAAQLQYEWNNALMLTSTGGQFRQDWFDVVWCFKTSKKLNCCIQPSSQASHYWLVWGFLLSSLEKIRSKMHIKTWGSSIIGSSAAD